MNNIPPARILALFTNARRRHRKFSAKRLERDLSLKPGSVARAESAQRVNKRDRFVLAAWCGIEGWL